MNSLKKNKNFVLFLVVMLFVAWRIIFLAGVHPYYFFFDFEDEIHRGTIGEELLSGAIFPLVQYQADNYGGGNLLIGIAAAISFKLFDTTAIALKLVPLFLMLLTLIVWFSLLAKRVNLSTAKLFALLFTFAPFPFIHYSMATLGDHMETLLFSGIFMTTLFTIVLEPEKKFRSYLLLGLVSGLGIWFTYTFGVVVIAGLLYGLWNDKRFFQPRFLLGFCLAFIIGIFPWLFFNLKTEFAGLGIHGRPLLEHFHPSQMKESLSDIRQIAFYRFFRSLGSDATEKAPRSLWDTGYIMVVLSILVISFRGLMKKVVVWRSQKRSIAKHPVSLFILVIVVFCFFSQISDFKRLKYFTMLHPFLFVILAWVLSQFNRSLVIPWGSYLSRVLALFAVFSVLTTFSIPHAGAVWKLKPYSYHTLAYGWTYSDLSACATWQGCLKSYQRIYDQLDPEDELEFQNALALRLAEEYEEARVDAVRQEIEQNIPADLKKIYSYYVSPSTYSRTSMLGYRFTLQNEGVWNQSSAFLTNLLVRVHSMKPKTREQFLAGVGRGVFVKWRWNPVRHQVLLSHLEQLPQQILEPILTGFAQNSALDLGLMQKELYEVLWKTQFSKTSLSYIRKTQQEMIESLFA